MKKKYLIIVAHPDDEVFGCGGYIAKLASEKNDIRAIYLSDGVVAKYNSIKKIKKRSELAAKVEKLLGFKWIKKYCGTFEDQKLDAIPLINLIKFIEKVKKEFDPDAVITHNSSDLNIDHAKVFEATFTAFRPKPNEKCKLFLCFEICSSTEHSVSLGRRSFIPNFIVNIEKFWSKKSKALNVYKEELWKYPGARSLKGIEIHNKNRGVQFGYKIAEAFEIIRKIEK